MNLSSFKGLIKRFLPKKRMAIAFGCGGAKGMAHLGVLKAFEEEGITFDGYAGTSIGSIVGALRAYGYTSDSLKDIVYSICLKEYVRYLRPYMDMSFIETLLNGYLHDVTFEKMPAPFYAWATDSKTMDGVLLCKGSVAKACTASSAVPPYFHSVEIDGKALIDGVYTNPIPADVLKKTGMDFIVGVDLNDQGDSNKPIHYYNRWTKIISTALDSTVHFETAKNAKQRGYTACDYVIKPPLETFTSLDTSKEGLQKMYEAGYEETKKQIPKVLQLMKEKKVI